MSQRSGARSQRGHASGQPPSNTSGSQRGAPGPPAVGAVVGRLYQHPQELIPSSDVRDLEDEYENSVDLASLSLASDSFPRRPGFGTQGREGVMWTNYFHLLVHDDRLVFYQYNIDIQPEAVGRKRFRIIELFLQRPESVAMSDRICSDFKSTLLSRTPLEDDFTACNIVYRSELENAPGPRAKVYQLRLQLKKPLPVRRFLESLTATNLSIAIEDRDAFVQAFNIFLNHFAKSRDDLLTIGNKTFPRNAPDLDLGRGLVAIRGFFSSVRLATGRILINVNVCCSAFLRPGPLGQFMTTHGVQDTYQLEQMLKGARVKTSYGGTPRIRSIVGLASPSDGQSTDQKRPRVQRFGAGPERVEFWFHETGRYVSVSEFFRRTHQVRANVGLPVVNVGSRANPVYLPADVCEVMSGHRAMGRLNTEQTSRMIQHAVRRPPPAHNALSIARDGLPMVGLSPQLNRLLNCFRVGIDPNFLAIPFRILPKPEVWYRKKVPVNPSAAWNIRDQAMTRPATIPAGTWGWLYITIPECRPVFRDLPHLQAALESFRQSLRVPTGINIGEASQGSRRLDLRNVEDPQLEQVLTAAAERLRLIYIILPVKHTGLYNRIKQICDVKIGLVNICSVGAKLLDSSGRPQYFGNVALKFNLKAGGENQTVGPSRLHFISAGDTMIVGIDATHPGPSSSKWAPSIAAMVASIDSKQTRYLATSYVQIRGRQEMVDRLKDMLERHLGLWKTEGRNHMFPQNILVYRDGVSEGQYKMVTEQELPLLRKACEVYGRVGQRLPRITIVIVAKRHHTRLGPMNEAQADSNGNCLAGIVVDRGLTKEYQWDFWMQAHSAIQGHARPAHYFVVHDEIFRTPPLTRGYTQVDTLQDITHSLHYTFGRCTRAVSYCTPAYYADLVCDRARRYLSQYYDPSAHSDTASVMSDLGEGEEADERRRARLQEMIDPHPRVRDSMYYI